MLAKEIQLAVFKALTSLFPVELVKMEWSVRSGADDAFADISSYAPRLDLAIGPFNVTFRNREEDADEIRNFTHPLIQSLEKEVNQRNHRGVYFNRNPRCSVAIEIEHRTSSKHMLGAITNASMLGRLGVVIGSVEYITKLRRIHSYACKLKEVEKARDDMFGNVGCFEEGEFLAFLRQPVKVFQSETGAQC
jgi:hypothetical protein